MGCAQSKIDNEESVSRCKDRKILMKDAVVARNHFAVAHSGYAVSVKNVGAALSDYGLGEAEEGLEEHQHLHQPLDATPPPPPPPPSSIDNLPPPPPPLPNFSPSPIKRAVSLPAIPMTHRKVPHGMDHVTIAEEDEEEEEEEVTDEALHKNSNKLKNKQNMNGTHEEVTPPRTPEVNQMPGAAWDYFFRVDDNMGGTSLDTEVQNRVDVDVDVDEPIEENAEDNISIGDNHKNDNDPTNLNHNFDNSNISNFNPNVNEDVVKEAERKVIEHSTSAPPELDGRRMAVSLMQVLNQIDDHFLKASQAAQDVSNMLEATRMHYHSNFADNREPIDHAARVMSVITWNKSFKGISNGEGRKDDFDSEKYETHATVLDKLLAWEKKLYEEVKQGELMKHEYQRKVAVLNKQKKRGASAESLEKIKTAVSHLHTRYIVDMQSLDSTVSEVNRLRDEQLYPKLVVLVDGMAKMWNNMSVHHDCQLKIVMDLKSLDITNTALETTIQHHERTKQLLKVIEEWHSQCDKLVTHQKQYIHALTSWLKLNLVPIESSLKEKISSPPRTQNPPIQPLLHSWHDYLEKLPDEIAKSAIFSFRAVIENIIVHQEEEMKLKEKCEETKKEYLRKKLAFEDWYQKYIQRRGPTIEMMEGERGEDGNTDKDPVAERQFVVESLKKKLDEEVEAHRRHCIQVRDKSLGSLKIRLPELFRAMSDYTHACCDAYEKLRAITSSRNSNCGS